ncbi:MAG: hypothetical protein A3C02_03890, partial [Candidatus Andersenbacteria bacterium RIFCSPHIGHO2_02_FULL_45_11]
MYINNLNRFWEGVNMQSLEEALNYKNDRVVNKFRVLYAVSLSEAQEIASEAYRWLWLNARLKQDRSQNLEGIPRILVIHSGMVVVDEYWHTFVLHTRDYEQFCRDYLGTFIHHSPATADFQPLSREETELQLNYICDVVGEDTMIRWYEEYQVRYSAEVLT